MNKDALIAKYQGKFEGMSKKEATAQVEAFIDSMVEGLTEDGSFEITKVFKISTKETAARNGRNPQTGESIAIPAGKKLALKPLKRLEEIIGK